MSLPLHCICGYQPQIDRLKKETQWVEQDLVSARAERDALRLKVLELSTEVERLSRELAR